MPWTLLGDETHAGTVRLAESVHTCRWWPTSQVSASCRLPLQARVTGQLTTVCIYEPAAADHGRHGDKQCVAHSSQIVIKYGALFVVGPTWPAVPGSTCAGLPCSCTQSRPEVAQPDPQITPSCVVIPSGTWPSFPALVRTMLVDLQLLALERPLAGAAGFDNQLTKFWDVLPWSTCGGSSHTPADPSASPRRAAVWGPLGHRPPSLPLRLTYPGILTSGARVKP